MRHNDKIQQDIDSGLYSLKEILEMHLEVTEEELKDAYDLSTLIPLLGCASLKKSPAD